MANATVSRLGLVNNTGSDFTALMLKVFAGEVLTTFEANNIFKPLHNVRSISSGKSAQFPVIGTATAASHTPGTELVGTAIKHNEKVITIDDLLVADVFVANIDEAMNHYDIRSAYSSELGTVLANTYDKHVAQTGVLAARAPTTITGGNGGTQVSHADMDDTGSRLATSIFTAAQTLDEKDVPENDRYCVLRPAQYYLVAQTTDVLNRDWGGSGAYAEGSVLKVAGIHIVKSNHLPSTNITTGDADYQGDFTKTQALVWHKSAMGTVSLMNVQTESAYDIRRQGSLLVGKYLCGHGILRPECAVELMLT